MKLNYLLILLFITSSLFGQSYWFGGMTRVPGGIDGSVGNFVIGGQNNSMESKLSSSVTESGNTLSINQGEEVVGFSTFQLGVEGAYAWPIFELEGGLDLGFSDMSSDLQYNGQKLDSYIDSFIGLNLKLGGVLKYDFEPSENLIITPFLRLGISLEYITNEISLPTYGYYNSYYYTPTYLGGSSFGNTVNNYSIGSALRWNGLVSSISLGKYQILSGDQDNDDVLDPTYLRLSLGYEFDSTTFSIGYKTEWDEDFSADWTGWALDANFEFRY